MSTHRILQRSGKAFVGEIYQPRSLPRVRHADNAKRDLTLSKRNRDAGAERFRKAAMSYRAHRMDSAE